MKLVSLKCRIAFVVTMLVSYAFVPPPDPFRKLRAGMTGSEVAQSPVYSVMSIAPAYTNAAPALAATTGLASLAMPIGATTTTAVTFADSTTALAPTRHAPITMTAGGVK